MSKKFVIPSGGPVYPFIDENGSITSGIHLREYLATKLYPLGEEECRAISIALAGECPSGTKVENPIQWLQWESKWRARIALIRSDIMIDEMSFLYE